MHRVVMVVGAPATGKTSIIRSVIGSNPQIITDKNDGAIKFTYTNDGCFAGHYTDGDFDGSDTIPRHGAPYCLDWWKKNVLHKNIKKFSIFDGDRFSNKTFIKFMKALIEEQRISFTCVYIAAADTTLEQRRKQRKELNPIFVKAKTTQSKKFAAYYQQKGMLVKIFNDDGNLDASVQKLIGVIDG